MKIKQLFHNKLFLFAVVLTALCVGIMVLAGAHRGSPTPLKNLLGIVVTPVEKAVSSVTGKASDLLGYFYRYDALEAENVALRARIAELEALEIEYRAAISENADLRKAANIRAKRRDFHLEPCSVVSVVGSSFESSFSIDKGTLSDIAVGDCVITEEGLVGYVSDVGLNHAQVTTLLNMDFSVSTTNRRTREVMPAGGDFALAGDGLLKASYLKNDADVQPGDVLITNGSGGRYPKDLIIGTVETFAVESHGLSSYATVRPAVDLDGLNTVLVVTDYLIEE